MDKNPNTNPNGLTNIEDMKQLMGELTPEAVALFEEAEKKKAIEQAKMLADKEEYLGKILNKKLKDDILLNSATSLTRKQQKAWKKFKTPLNEYIWLLDNGDAYIDNMLKVKGISDAQSDDLEVGELTMWLEKIIIATLDPIRFEGN